MSLRGRWMNIVDRERNTSREHAVRAARKLPRVSSRTLPLLPPQSRLPAPSCSVLSCPVLSCRAHKRNPTQSDPTRPDPTQPNPNQPNLGEKRRVHRGHRGGADRGRTKAPVRYAGVLQGGGGGVLDRRGVLMPWMATVV